MENDPQPAGKDAELLSDPGRNWLKIEELFHRASDLPPGEREQQLKDWCGTDASLLAGVMALIEADLRVESLIANAGPLDPGGFLVRELAAGAEAGTASDAWLGRVLGAFRLERLLGRGGMGVVYLGTRISGGFAQQVAVKLVGQHLRSSPAISQFLLERQTLAALEHDNIARLLDGGVSEEGFPYVVMEYVEGRRLDAACDDPATSTEDILRWMLQLCDAMGYVHRNLILHRDLKPGNVMVTGEGAVKLLDFGTLKRIGPEAGSESAMTQAGMRAITLHYASPEHILGAPVSTASDVYSLGMMLYRLLAGRTPEELDDLPVGAYVERLKEERFTPPSKLATRVIPPHFAADLDAIVAKSLRYDSEGRYRTAGGLAEDLENVLAGRPVSAREGSLRYRAAKFYQRHRTPILAVAAVFLVVVAGLAVMGWQERIARQQQIRAEKGVEDERQLAHMLLFDYFDKLGLIPGSTDAQRKAVTQAIRYLDSLAGIAPDSMIELDTIRAYVDIGGLMGDPYRQNLGDIPGALKTLDKAMKLAQARVQRQPHDLESLSARADIEELLGSIYLGSGDAPHAEYFLKAAAATSAAIASDPRRDAKMLQQAALATDTLGDLYDPGKGLASADLAKAMASYAQSDAYDEECLRVDPANTRCRTDVVIGQYKFGLLVEDSDPALALAHYSQGLSLASQAPETERKNSRGIRLRNFLASRLGMMELRTGHTAAGLAHVQEAQAGFRNTIAKDDLDNRARFDLAAFEQDLTNEYADANRPQQAYETAHEMLQTMEVLTSRNSKNVRWQMFYAQSLLIDGKLEMKLGHTAPGLAASRKGLELAVKLAGAPDASPEMLDTAADALLEQQADPRDAVTALEFAQRVVNSLPKPTAAQLLTLARAQAATGHSAEAQHSAARVLAILNGPVKSHVIQQQIDEARHIQHTLQPD